MHAAPLRSTVHPRLFTHDFDHVDSIGRRTKLKYDVTIPKSSLFLEDEAKVLSMQCTSVSVSMKLGEPLKDTALSKLKIDGCLFFYFSVADICFRKALCSLRPLWPSNALKSTTMVSSGKSSTFPFLLMVSVS